MKFLSKAVIIATLGATTFAIAQTSTDPVIQARKDLMQQQRAATATLGGMAGGQAAFDAAAAMAAKAVLVDTAARIPAVFEADVTDATSKAKPEIWMDWEAYVAKSEALLKAAEAIDASSLDGVKAGMGAIGGSCQACHQEFRL